jgi:uncharacterized protein (DUF1697 family)
LFVSANKPTGKFDVPSFSYSRATMPKFIALLRGVNVGKAKRVPMEGFRALLRGLGYGSVQTLLNSGNALFDVEQGLPDAVAHAIQRALHSAFGFDVPTLVKSAAQLAQIVAENPIVAVADPARLLVVFTQSEVQLRTLEAVTSLVTSTESFVLGQHAAYLYCADGLLTSKAALALLGKLGSGCTTRNWATTLKLHLLANGG